MPRVCRRAAVRPYITLARAWLMQRGVDRRHAQLRIATAAQRIRGCCRRVRRHSTAAHCLRRRPGSSRREAARVARGWARGAYPRARGGGHHFARLRRPKRPQRRQRCAEFVHACTVQRGWRWRRRWRRFVCRCTLRARLATQPGRHTYGRRCQAPPLRHATRERAGGRGGGGRRGWRGRWSVRHIRHARHFDGDGAVGGQVHARRHADSASPLHPAAARSVQRTQLRLRWRRLQRRGGGHGCAQVTGA